MEKSIPVFVRGLSSFLFLRKILDPIRYRLVPYHSQETKLSLGLYFHKIKKLGNYYDGSIAVRKFLKLDEFKLIDFNLPISDFEEYFYEGMYCEAKESYNSRIDDLGLEGRLGVSLVMGNDEGELLQPLCNELIEIAGRIGKGLIILPPIFISKMSLGDLLEMKSDAEMSWANYNPFEDGKDEEDSMDRETDGFWRQD